MRAVRFRRELGQQRFEGGLHVAHKAEVNARAPADLFAAEVHLNDRRLMRIKLLIRKIRAEHEQHVAIHHRVITGGKPEQPGHAHVKRIVVFNEFLAAQGVNDGRFQCVGHGNQFVVRARAASAAQNGHAFRLVQNAGQPADFFVRRTNGGLGFIKMNSRSPVRRCGAKRNVAGQHDDGDTALRDGGLNGDFQNPRHLLRLRNQFAIMTAFAEQTFRPRLLKIVAANFLAGNVRRNRQHRHAAAMAVVKAVDQMQIARPAASGANGEFPRQVGLRAGGKRGGFLVAHAGTHLMLSRVRMESVMPLSESPASP